ncbi:hypothetical protein MAPG_03110 [Magnaporthiopsis poae ATCC 64411]|uniref:Mitochondrial division protein 1 n=1 Tax=Magnaporthiopsis poae (strain ATCC 64411 / 73-15) TaxID=644358 RepID=A0A0C4DT53_MAGP6|nr:hypothetical protein MAPG_03110 [Magnaporthiopsis poae ATCC 64411]
MGLDASASSDASPSRDAAIHANASGNILQGSGMQINAPIAAINQYFQDVESKEALFVRDLYITDPWRDKKRIEDAKGGLLEESYSWILERPAFRDWRDRSDASVLWIKGGPGTGKTMLLCGIVGALADSMRPQDCLSFFFCEAGNKNADSAAAVLRGIMYLLVRQRPKLISSTALEEHKRAGSKLFEGLGAWYALRDIFLDLLPDLRREGVTYFVIDALDECGEELERLLSFISKAASARSSGVKWLVSSRRRVDVARHLEVGKAAGRQDLDLDDCSEELTNAVNAYIGRCACELAPDPRDDGRRQQICEGLRQKAGGTFQYVTLAVAKLRVVSTHEVLDVLREAAPDMEGLYRQASDRIQNLERETRHLCRSVLATVAIAHRPLNREELYALAGLPSSDGNGNGGGTAEDIILKCDSFGIKGLTTFSLDLPAREFLLGDKVLFPDGFEGEHRRVFLRSLALMEATLRRDMYGLGRPGFLAVDMDRVPNPNPNPLAASGYACEYWIEHLVASSYHGRDTKDGGALLAFLESRYLYWLEGLSLLGAMRTALSSWTKLVDYLRGKKGARRLAELVVDAQRFLEYNGQCIMARPLQAYASAVVFVPSGSTTGEVVWVEEPKWVAVDAGMREERWSPWAQTLEPSGAGLRVVGPVAFSPDGAWLAAALQGDRDDGEIVRKVQVWDVVTGNTVWTLGDAGGWMAFPPNHLLLATVAGPDEVKFWDLAKGVWDRRVISPLNISAAAAAFSPDGVWLAAADRDSIVIWDWARGDRTLRFLHDSRATACHSLAYSASGARLASAYKEEIRVWNAHSGSLICSIETRDATWIAFLPDPAVGGRLVSASNESLVTWSIDTVQRLGVLNVPSEHGHYNDSVVTISPDGSRFAAAPDGAIMTWDTATRRRLQTIQGYDQDVRSLAISPDGRQIASIGKWGLRLYRATSADGDLLRAARDHPEKINAVRVSAGGGDTMVSASASTINVWDLGEAARPSREIRGEGILDVTLSPDGTRLVSLSSCQDVAVWDTKTGRSLQAIAYRAFAASFSPDGGMIALLTFAGPIRVWDLAEEMCVRTFQQAAAGEFGSGSVAFGPDHRVATSSDRTIRVWKVFNGRCIQTIKDDGTARSLIFRSDGSQLAALYSDTIRVWDPAKGCCLRTFDTGSCRISNVVAFDDAAAGSSRLQTDAGLILLDDEAPPPAAAEDGSLHRRGLRRQGYGVDASSGWVTWDSKKVLWLPPAYRPDSTAVLLPEPGAPTPSAIVLGCRSGRVVVLRFPTGLAPGQSS